MKSLWACIFALPLAAAEPEGTAWYDAEGKLVRVDGPAAEPAKQPFVADWRKREIERRERYQGFWSSEIQPVWGGYFSPRPRYYRGFHHYGGYSTGVRERGRYFGGHYRFCPSRYGASVVIRW